MQANQTRRMSRLIHKRILAVMLIFGILVFIAPVAKLYQIQIIDHDKYTAQAEQQQTGDTVITPNRGTIYDRNGEVLAQSVSVETVVINPSRIKNEETRVTIAQGLSEILDVTYEKVYEATLKDYSGNEYIKKKIDKETADLVRAFRSKEKLTDIVNLVTDTLRVYRNNNLASHIIGFVGTENKGLMGIEAVYDTVLTGTAGKIVTARDASGGVVPYQYEKYIDAQDGADVVLTIDATIQYFLESALEQAIVDNDVQQYAQGIVYDVKTGEILAMSTKNDFDLNDPFTITDQKVLDTLDSLQPEERTKALNTALQALWRNKSVNDTYEPGSVFKIITTAIGLETGAVKETDTFTCTGSLKVAGYGTPISCWKHGGHGTQSFVKGVQNSCNPVFMTVGQRIGGATFYDYMEAFGLMNKTGVDLQGETNSITLSKTLMERTLELSITAFGQTNKFTPLQMVAAVSAVANSGKLMQPHIVKETRDADGNIIESFEPTTVRQVISEETAKRTCEILETVVSEGTGKNAKIVGYRVAGKTGTSEKTDERDAEGNLVKDSNNYIVSFLAFAPADDPQIAVLITLDQPGGPVNLRTGGYMAAPVARTVLENVLPYWGVEPQYSAEDKALVDINVPNLKALTLDEAKKELIKKDLKYRIVGDGELVTDQVPAGGAVVPGTAEVVLYMGESKPETTVTVPDVTGMTQTQAETALAAKGLYMRALGTVGVSGGKVVAEKQTITAGTQVAEGTVVEVTFFDEDALH